MVEYRKKFEFPCCMVGSWLKGKYIQEIRMMYVPEVSRVSFGSIGGVETI